MSQVLGVIIIYIGIVIFARGLSWVVMSFTSDLKTVVKTPTLAVLCYEALTCLGGFIMWLGFHVVGVA